MRTPVLRHIAVLPLILFLSIGSLLSLQAQNPDTSVRRSVFLPVDSSSIAVSEVETESAADSSTVEKILSAEEIHRLFDAKQYGRAAAAYERILRETDRPDASLLYNLGCCYYKSGEVALSILMFERAYRLAPNDKDIRVNLEMARLKAFDKIPDSESIAAKLWRRLCYSVSSGVIVVAGIICFIIFLGSILLFLLGGSRKLRRGGFYAAWVSLFFCILLNLAAFRRKADFHDDSYCIMMASVANVKSSPDEDGTTLFELHEGVRVRITGEPIDGWYPIELADGKEGWLPQTVLTRIHVSPVD
ncbi:peptide-binding protein [Porphyromonas gulae]|uniref:SH3 domain-containing protein n=2 Tax=Porphyromonas gulae TaxID=111105 RepID=UPI00047632AE|nr:SH3 domain-containing protein [Porphyromonas gulae]KGL49134.1 peptide-binding protein [Porphyromonas gulae]KGN80670.1 peptide-binding protein [Porphyromonas gulae]KGN88481.1 peptide-binding protein [Porphyromonas gulae]